MCINNKENAMKTQDYLMNNQEKSHWGISNDITLILKSNKTVGAYGEINLEKLRQPNAIILGKPGLGRKIYPWSVLNKCKCGNEHPWMHGFKPCSEVIEEGANYRVVCHKCFRHTHKGTYEDVVQEWNSKICRRVF